MKDRVIVKTELYSICRNPLYFSSFLMALGTGLLFARLDFGVLLVTAFVLIFYPMMGNEARVLEAKFPDYLEYRGRVPLFFPNFKLWKEREHYQIDFRLLKRTLLDSCLILLTVPVMLFLQVYAYPPMLP